MPQHSRKTTALIRISCECGWFWRNGDSLKGKTDVELELARDEAFNKHVEDMVRQGL